jgi:hypothetical protein
MKKIIGYRSTVYGDESTELIDVYELDADEQVLRALQRSTEEKLRALHRIPKSELKPTEIGKLAELDAVMDQIRSECRHRVFKDEAGFIYAIRSCVTCGAHMGTV